MQNSPTASKQKILSIWIIICAGIGGLIFGYDIGAYSGAVPLLKKSLSLTTSQLGIIGGASFGGGLICTVIAGHLLDLFGRRKVILFAIPFCIGGVILLLFANNFLALLLAKLMIGICAGITAVAVPSYISEISPKGIRGANIATFQLFITLGILSAYIVDSTLASSGNWRFMLTAVSIPAIFLFITTYSLPESPRWLLSIGKNKKAYEMLRRTRSAQEAESEINEISKILPKNGPQWRDLLSRSLIAPLILAIFVAIFNQLTAINCFLQYV